MPGRKSSSGSEGKPPSSKPDPKSGSQPKGSPDKKGKGPMPKSTQDEPSKENRPSRAGEPSTHTQPLASEGNTTQAMPGQSSGGERYGEEHSRAGPWNSQGVIYGESRKEVAPGESTSDYPQHLDDADTADDQVEEKEEKEEPDEPDELEKS